MKNEEHPQSNLARKFANDPVVFLGCVFSCFSMVGIADSFVKWKEFFANFLQNWNEFVNFIIPFSIDINIKNNIMLFAFVVLTAIRCNNIVNIDAYRNRLIEYIIFVEIICVVIFVSFDSLLSFVEYEYIDCSLPGRTENGLITFFYEFIGGFYCGFVNAPRIAVLAITVLGVFIGPLSIFIPVAYFTFSKNSSPELKEFCSAMMYCLLITLTAFFILIMLFRDSG